MKFFKHFTDAHRGRSLQILNKKFGVAGIGRYWIFVELCAEKLDRKKDEALIEDDCFFRFEKSYLMQCLGYGNLMHLKSYLGAMSVLDLCSISENDVEFECSMPKLLESIDRDTKRARKNTPKNKRKNKEEDKEQDKEKEEEAPAKVAKAPEIYAFDFELIYSNYPKRSGDSKKKTGIEYLKKKITSQELFDQALMAVKNYSDHCHAENKTGSTFVKQFSTFFGADETWREYIAYVAPMNFGRSTNRSEQRLHENQASLQTYLNSIGEARES